MTSYTEHQEIQQKNLPILGQSFSRDFYLLLKDRWEKKGNYQKTNPREFDHTCKYKNFTRLADYSTHQIIATLYF